MSYTRFGTESDVFVYRSVKNTWVISVAGERFVPQPGQLLPATPDSSRPPEEYSAALAAQRKALDAGHYEPLPGPMSGRNYQVATPGECASMLRALQKHGYRVPVQTIGILDYEHRSWARA